MAISEGNAIDIRNLNKTFEGPGFWQFKRVKKLTTVEDLSYSGKAQEAWGLRVWYIPPLGGYQERVTKVPEPSCVTTGV